MHAIEGLKESLRLLSLAEAEHQAAKRSVLVSQWQENDSLLQSVRNKLKSRRTQLEILKNREKALAEGKHLKFVESARNHLTNGDPAAAFRDIQSGERIAGDSPELAAVREEVRAAFSKDPSKIASEEQARWFYRLRSFGDIYQNGLSVGDVFEGVFWISQRFDHHEYRAQFQRHVEVVIESAERLPDGPRAFIVAMVRVTEERKFQRAFGTTVILPVVEVLFRSR